MKLVFFGAPGAGKGTIAKILNQEYGIPQISTGDLFRANIKNKTELGKKVSEILDKGGLVPDEVTIAMVEQRVKDADCKNGYILDGFPRTLVQAEAWEKIAKIDKAIYFDISDEEVKTRLGGRRVCPKCGAIYHIVNNKPKKDNTCNADGETLIIRPDDSVTAISNRLDVYHKQTEPLLAYYKKLGKEITVNASLKPEAVASELKKKASI
jgi:adenylate kinase